MVAITTILSALAILGSTIVTAAPAPAPIDLAARGQCPNSLVLTCAGLIYKKDFVGTVEKCGQCIKESTLCVEIYLAAKVNKDICKFAKNTLKCDAIRFTGLGENGFSKCGVGVMKVMVWEDALA
ncbi:hypothetical protein BDK51DRAFT_42001 [Blyttiomyces helicus]|uniref:RlpA-like double-psi beta-barrel-protein domain-containing protein-containing protein n=1 Tax=Blyttiomyces helicus TaxID=388810 RepID=A0A4P9VYJ9_9FUNG|nr:hypothetical protein BDK51DRAFT_42001 [Blyttiomyces helicus]|eukprot:RKO82866.1 hypothetical protein BDK51DRAFT_42001 [Blyttiomyces helicus]